VIITLEKTRQGKEEEEEFFWFVAFGVFRVICL
jgi:hypothetical protein